MNSSLKKFATAFATLEIPSRATFESLLPSTVQKTPSLLEKNSSGFLNSLCEAKTLKDLEELFSKETARTQPSHTHLGLIFSHRAATAGLKLEVLKELVKNSSNAREIESFLPQLRFSSLLTLLDSFNPQLDKKPVLEEVFKRAKKKDLSSSWVALEKHFSVSELFPSFCVWLRKFDVQEEDIKPLVADAKNASLWEFSILLHLFLGNATSTSKRLSPESLKRLVLLGETLTGQEVRTAMERLFTRHSFWLNSFLFEQEALLLLSSSHEDLFQLALLYEKDEIFKKVIEKATSLTLKHNTLYAKMSRYKLDVLHEKALAGFSDVIAPQVFSLVFPKLKEEDGFYDFFFKFAVFVEKDLYDLVDFALGRWEVKPDVKVLEKLSPSVLTQAFAVILATNFFLELSCEKAFIVENAPRGLSLWQECSLSASYKEIGRLYASYLQSLTKEELETFLSLAEDFEGSFLELLRSLPSLS